MGRARARIELEGPVSAAEDLWYDQSRWPTFVEGFASIVKREGEWPKPGARVIWDSGRAGRGRVVERVVAYEPRRGQTVAVEDPKLRGEQRIAFANLEGERIAVELELEYTLKDTFGGPVVDLLFVRRALNDSMRRTLARFARELEAERELSR